jgi:hypothetical protein
VLGDEGFEQRIERLHDRCVATDLVRPVFLDQADALVLDVAGNDAGERAAQVGGQFVGRLVAVQLRLAMFSWVGSNGRWKPSSIFSSQLKWNASLRSRRNCFTA